LTPNISNDWKKLPNIVTGALEFLFPEGLVRLNRSLRSLFHNSEIICATLRRGRGVFAAFKTVPEAVVKTALKSLNPLKTLIVLTPDL